jgi:hypothetical protein
MHSSLSSVSFVKIVQFDIFGANLHIIYNKTKFLLDFFQVRAISGPEMGFFLHLIYNIRQISGVTGKFLCRSLTNINRLPQ